MAESAPPRPNVHVDAGAEGRVMVADSLSFYEHEPWINDVAVGASFAGAPTAAMAMRQGVKAWIAHEAGPGKDEAGVSGLPFADRYGVPAAAIATMEARLGDGRTLLTGHVSRANRSAEGLGVRAGQTGDQAARLMRDPRLDALAHRHRRRGGTGEGGADGDIVDPRLMLVEAQRIRDHNPALASGIDIDGRPARHV